jgi:outer membrane protein assembly factor BamC
MNRLWIRVGVCIAACAALAACNFELPTKKVQYKSSGKLPPLDVPPDLTRPAADDRFAVPESQRGAATFSEYQRGREGRVEQPGSGAVLPIQDGARVERAGTQRWLVIKGDPEQMWPLVKDFWQEIGFIVNVEMPEAGVMETDWAENRARVPDGFIRNTLGRVLDSVYSTGERDKFRTRLERGTQAGTTEIYISHRGVAEVFTNQQQDSTVWQPRPSDPELEAEFLRRLMVRFGVEETRAQAQLAPVATAERAKLVRSQDGGGSLELAEPFDRAWRRVGLALDRVGFTVEDRDRSKGYYFVRYIDPQKDAQSTAKRDEGLLSRLAFWRSDKPAASPEQYRVMLKDQKDATAVQVLNKDGASDRSDTARRILSLLHDQLK